MPMPTFPFESQRAYLSPDGQTDSREVDRFGTPSVFLRLPPPGHRGRGRPRRVRPKHPGCACLPTRIPRRIPDTLISVTCFMFNVFCFMFTVPQTRGDLAGQSPERKRVGTKPTLSPSEIRPVRPVLQIIIIEGNIVLSAVLDYPEPNLAFQHRNDPLQ